MSEAMRRTLAPLARGLRNMIARGVVRLVDDAFKMQVLQIDVTAGETLDGVEHWHPYGFTTHPQTGAEALLVCLGGTRAKPVVVACADRRYRLTGLAAGEVAIHDDLGRSLIFRRSGIEITGPVKITGTVEIHGALTQTGDVQVTGQLNQTGDVQVTGQLNQTGNLAVTGSVAATTTVTGATGVSTGTSSLATVAGAVTALAGTYAAHRHGNVYPGDGQTSTPF